MPAVVEGKKLRLWRIWFTAPPSGLLQHYLWWGYFDIDDDGSQRGLCQLGGVVDGVCIQSDQLEGARQLKDALNFTLHLSWKKYNKIKQASHQKQIQTHSRSCGFIHSIFSCFRLVQHHACLFFCLSQSQAHGSDWTRSIYAQLNGAVQHPHSVAASQHFAFSWRTAEQSLERGEALENEMPVALV